jgi:hypothetical protein
MQAGGPAVCLSVFRNGFDTLGTRAKSFKVSWQAGQYRIVSDELGRPATAESLGLEKRPVPTETAIRYLPGRKGEVRINPTTAYCMASDRLALRIFDEAGQYVWEDHDNLAYYAVACVAEMKGGGTGQIVVFLTDHGEAQVLVYERSGPGLATQPARPTAAERARWNRESAKAAVARAAAALADMERLHEAGKASERDLLTAREDYLSRQLSAAIMELELVRSEGGDTRPAELAVAVARVAAARQAVEDAERDLPRMAAMYAKRLVSRAEQNATHMKAARARKELSEAEKTLDDLRGAATQPAE